MRDDAGSPGGDDRVQSRRRFVVKAWLRFFRVVNLPTVPGDVLVGAAVVAAFACDDPSSAVRFRPIALALACVASCCLYLFGLADNDIVGAAKDKDRPIPLGEISLTAARSVRALCLFGALIVGTGLPAGWWPSSFALVCMIVLYNRTKFSPAMGLCRGLNVLCGGLLVIPGGTPRGLGAVLGLAFLWTICITFVTLYSKGEETDPVKRQRVGFLIGAIVYLQLGALLLAYEFSPTIVTRNLLLAGAGLLIVLRLMKRFLPGVSAS